MEFHSFIFLSFFSICLIVYQRISSDYRKHWILACSYFFYAWWNPWYLGLILISTAVDYWCSIQMVFSNSLRKKLLLAISLTVNLGILLSFKYAGWLILDVAGFSQFDVLNRLLLPVGISFYTFQTLSYTIDVYRGIQKPETNWVNFALFVSFFPQLVAGPIERAGSLLPQLNKLKSLSASNLGSGLLLMLWGFFKKLVIADRFALYSDAYFNSSSPPQDNLWAIFAVLSFGMQILFDFSAYTDIARGAAKCLGVNLMENFKSPYRARGIRSFWSRWHISLSTWFRDYFYISLGGNRKTEKRILLNLMLTFLVSGLWHGANTTFVWWGLLHGFFYVVEKSFKKTGIKLPSLVEWGLTFCAVHLAWIFFRSESTTHAFEVIHAFTSRSSPISFELWQQLSCLEPQAIKQGVILSMTVTLTALALIVDHKRQRIKKDLSDLWRAEKMAFASIILIVAIIFAGTFGQSTFIYFQF
jgi:alginate O-acetyltransferase complex protein AlgI